MNRYYSFKNVVVLICIFTVAAVAATTAFFTFVVVPKREGGLYGYNSKMLEINDLVDK